MSREVDINLINTMAENSAYAINAYDLKNRKKFPYLPTKIIDNFFDTPSVWREFALSQEYTEATTGTWPGTRTELLNDISNEIFEEFALQLLKHLPMYTGFHRLVASFHLIDETYGSGWIHDDDPTLDVSGIVYLTPNAPLGTGTTLYDDQYDANAATFNKRFKEDVLYSTPESRKQLEKYRLEQRSMFTPNTVIENVYNRCVIFDPRTWHSPNNFFGTTKENTRLTLVFFAKGGR